MTEYRITRPFSELGKMDTTNGVQGAVAAYEAGRARALDAKTEEDITVERIAWLKEALLRRAVTGK